MCLAVWVCGLSLRAPSWLAWCCLLGTLLARAGILYSTLQRAGSCCGPWAPLPRRLFLPPLQPPPGHPQWLAPPAFLYPLHHLDAPVGSTPVLCLPLLAPSSSPSHTGHGGVPACPAPSCWLCPGAVPTGVRSFRLAGPARSLTTGRFPHVFSAHLVNKHVPGTYVPACARCLSITGQGGPGLVLPSSRLQPLVERVLGNASQAT